METAPDPKTVGDNAQPVSPPLPAVPETQTNSGAIPDVTEPPRPAESVASLKELDWKQTKLPDYIGWILLLCGIGSLVAGYITLVCLFGMVQTKQSTGAGLPSRASSVSGMNVAELSGRTLESHAGCFENGQRLDRTVFGGRRRQQNPAHTQSHLPPPGTLFQGGDGLPHGKPELGS